MYNPICNQLSLITGYNCSLESCGIFRARKKLASHATWKDPQNWHYGELPVVERNAPYQTSTIDNTDLQF